MAYTYLASDLATGDLLADLPLTSVRWGRALNGSGPLTARLKMLPATPGNRLRNATWKDATDRKRRAIYVLRDGTPMGAWEIHERRYDWERQTIEIRGAELFSYFDGRLFGSTGSVTARRELVRHTGSPIGVAAEILAPRATAIRLELSAVTSPPGMPTITWEGRAADGKTVGAIIADLSKGEGDLGFDYRVDLVGDPADLRRVLVMGPVVGADVGLIAKLTRPHGQGNIASGGIIEDARRANFVLALGQGDGASRVTAEAATSDWLPRVSSVVTYTDEIDAMVLQARANARLRATRDIAIPDLRLRSDKLDAQLGVFNPGDVGIITVEPDTDPYFPDGLWVTQRVVGFDVTVPDTNDAELVSFKLDDPVGDYG